MCGGAVRLRLLALVLVLVVGAVSVLAIGGPPPADTVGEASSFDVVMLVAYVSLALVFSFLCSVAEAVLLSITPSYIAGLKERNPQRAALIEKLKQDDVDRSLAAILTLNTIAHTVGAIGSGAKATVVFGSAWFGVFSAIMTLMILFLSEIIPKTLGAVHWRRLVRPTATFIRLLIFMLYPLIWISERLTRLVARGAKVHAFSREEFVAMAGVGERAGELHERESRIIRNLFRFDRLWARDIMTPSTVISALQEDLTVSDVFAEEGARPFSRLPVYATNLDDVTGFVMKDDILAAKARDEHSTRLSALKRELLNVSAEMPLSELFDLLLDKRQHIALVLGEYGETVGLVTIEDVIETLVGLEIVDETDTVEDMRVLARRQWERRARSLGIDMDQFRESEDRLE